MSNALILLASNLTSLAAVVFAGMLAMEGKPGWGWFLTISVITVTSKFGTKDAKAPASAPSAPPESQPGRTPDSSGQ